MKILKDILYKVAIESVTGSTDIDIQKIEFDSQQRLKQMIFLLPFAVHFLMDTIIFEKAIELRSCRSYL